MSKWQDLYLFLDNYAELTTHSMALDYVQTAPGAQNGPFVRFQSKFHHANFP